MSKYRTPEEYRAMVRNMGVQELMGLADTFNESQTLSDKDIVIQNILNNEVERRINNWEIAEV
jgi:hypothetical protein